MKRGKWGVCVSLFLLFTLIGFIWPSGNTLAEEVQHHGLLVQYAENYQLLAIDETLPEGVESKETIVDQTELWNLEDGADVEAIINELESNPAVLQVEPNFERELHFAFNDSFADSQWWLPHVKPQNLWARTAEQKKSAVVAVIDSGIDTAHEDLKGRIQPGGFNFYHNNANVQDVQGHGTMVAGVVAAASGNGIGISGIAGKYDVKVLPLKVSHSDGRSSVATILKAIDYAITKNVDVINVSMGSPNRSVTEEAAIQRAVQAGITFVASSGNDGMKTNPVIYPAAYPNVISVGAVDRDNKRASFSSYNSAVDLTAPGVDIYTTDIQNRYKQVNGTSFSAPIVAGAAAVVKSLKPELSPYQVKGLLEETASDLGAAGRDIHFGEGLLNMERLSKKLHPSIAHVPVSSVELHTAQLTIDLEKSAHAIAMGAEGLDELESARNQAAIEYEREPNDSFVSANRLTPGNSMVGSITKYYFDVDHYRVTLDSLGRFSFLAGWIEGKYASHRDNNYLSVGVYNSQQQLMDIARLTTLSNGEKAMYYSKELPKGTYYLVVLQSSPYQYLFVDEKYMITSLFTPAEAPAPEPVPEPKPKFLFDWTEMRTGETARFVANMEKAAQLSSSNPQTATVDSSGTVRAVNRGSARIRYLSNTTDKTALVKVTGQNGVPTAALFERVLPANATDHEVTWSSSNPKVAEVDEYGIITGKQPGTAIVTVRTRDGGKTANTTVTVKGKEPAPEFKTDFPDIQADPNKTFKVTFNQALQVGKDYSNDILISRSPDGTDRITGFTATVDRAVPTKLYIKPDGKWQEGMHYLTVNKNVQNEKSVLLKKDYRIKFNVMEDFSVGDLQEVKVYERYLEMIK